MVDGRVAPSACSALFISALCTSLHRLPCKGWHSCYFSRQWGLEGVESERQEFCDQMTSEGRPDQTKLDRCHHGKKIKAKDKKKQKQKHLVLVELTQHLRREGLKNSLRKSPDLEPWPCDLSAHKTCHVTCPFWCWVWPFIRIPWVCVKYKVPWAPSHRISTPGTGEINLIGQFREPCVPWTRRILRFFFSILSSSEVRTYLLAQHLNKPCALMAHVCCH